MSDRSTALRVWAVHTLRTMPDSIAERTSVLTAMLKLLPDDCDVRPFAERMLAGIQVHADSHQQFLAALTKPAK